MRAAILKGFVFLAVAGAVGIFIAQQRSGIERLRDEAARLREKNAEALRVADSERELALRKAKEERDRHAAEANEAERLRAELAGLEHAVANLAQSNQHDGTSADFSSPSPKQWTNVGNATPRAAFESVVWSAVNGDVDTLASLIAFDSAGRAHAEELFARLPESARASSQSPEKILATLLALRLPQDLTAARVTQSEEANGEARLHLHLEHEGGTTKDANFYFNRGPNGWRLIVPATIVDNYQRMLANAPDTTAGK